MSFAGGPGWDVVAHMLNSAAAEGQEFDLVNMSGVVVHGEISCTREDYTFDERQKSQIADTSFKLSVSALELPATVKWPNLRARLDGVTYGITSVEITGVRDAVRYTLHLE